MDDLSLQLQVNKSIRLLEQDTQPRSWPAAAAELMTVHPEKYLQVVELLGSGASLEKIARSTGVSKIALRAIRDRHPAALEAYQASIRRNIEEAAHLTTERIIESIDEISPNKLGFLMDMLIKSGQLLAGGPTSRHEQVHVASPEDLEQMYKQLPAADVKEI